MKRTLLLFIVASLAYGQTANVQKSTATATLNQISGDLTFGSGKTLTLASGSTLVAQSLTAPASTALALAAGSGNQNITLTPSGTGVLSVVTANNIAGALTLGNGAGVMTLGFDPGTNAKLVTKVGSSFAILPGGSSNLFTFLSNGNLQIGTGVDSGALLQVGANTTTSAGGMVFGTDTFLYRVGAAQLQMGTTTANLFFGAAGSINYNGTDFIVGTNTAAKGVILQSGAGTTALTLDSAQKATFAGAVRFSTYGAGSATFDSSGNITSVSDARMKNITGTFTKGLAEIVKLTPKLYTWKPETGLVSDDVVASLIAQDLIAAGIPEAVSTYRTIAVMENDAQSAEDIAAGKPVTQHAKLDAAGKPVTQRVDANYSVSDRTVIAALVNAVKELKTEIDALKAR